jgi:putative oxidoreductase
MPGGWRVAIETDTVGRASDVGSERAIDAAALVLRLTLGIILLGHALQKFGWFKGGGYPTSINTQADFVKFFGYDHTHVMAWLITLTEAMSGVLLVLGFLTPLAVAGVMGIAFQFFAGPQWSAGLYGDTKGAGGFEFTLMMFSAAAALGFTGAGRLSLDRRFARSLRGVWWGFAAIALAVVVGTIVLVGFGVGLGGHPPAPPHP